MAIGYSNLDFVSTIQLNNENRFQLYYEDAQNQQQCIDIELSEKVLDDFIEILGIVHDLVPVLKNYITHGITINIIEIRYRINCPYGLDVDVLKIFIKRAYECLNVRGK